VTELKTCPHCGTSWKLAFSEAHDRAFNVAVASSTIDLTAAAQKAADLLTSETQDPRAQNAFMRELGQSELRQSQWFFLLTTLLELKNHDQENARRFEGASSASAQD